MASYKSIFLRYLDREDIGYEERDEFTVKIMYGGENLKNIPIFVHFDEDGDPFVQCKCWDIANFKGKESKGLIACNNVNNEYRWVKYCLDEDADIVASIDGYIDSDTCAEVTTALVHRVGSITDDAYPIFAKAMWA